MVVSGTRMCNLDAFLCVSKVLISVTVSTIESTNMVDTRAAAITVLVFKHWTEVRIYVARTPEQGIRKLAGLVVKRTQKRTEFADGS